MIPFTKYNPTQEYDFISKTKSHRKGDYKLLTEPIFLDTETSWNHDEENPVGWIYQWAIRFGCDTVTGRKPSELITTLKRIASTYEADESNRIIVYCHNLSYDIQYLKNWLFVSFGVWKILAISPHHFITFECGPFVFKCSYMLSNRSLAKWGKDLAIEQKKLEGAIDYDLIRYQDTPLTDIDNAYMEYDVLALQECIRKQLKIYGDDITSIPLTSTGYVRRDARTNARKDPSDWDKFQACKMTLTIYSMLLSAFAGGFTHGNRHLADKTIKCKIGHRDFTSHYPTQQMLHLFPCGPWFNITEPTIEKIKQWQKRGYCLVFEVAFRDVELINKQHPMPYLQASKVRAGARSKLACVEDNGRILKVDGIFSVCVTEVDWEIIERMYNWNDCKILTAKRSAAKPLPKWMRETVLKYFHGKTFYKEEGKKEKDPERKADLAISLMKSKNGLNGIYGLTATRPVRQELVLDEDGNWRTDESKTDEQKLKDFYKTKNSFMRYAWGVWTTAYARYQLMEAVELIANNHPEGYNAFLYADTDSVFYKMHPQTEAAFDKWNEEMKQQAEKAGAFTEYDGKKVFMNQMDEEGEGITAFRFLHAKCYAYETSEGLKATIAGVPARAKDGTTREEELGCIDNLCDKMIFRKCGGNRIIYTEQMPTEVNIDGHLTELSSAACIAPTTKELNTLRRIGLENSPLMEGLKHGTDESI